MGYQPTSHAVFLAVIDKPKQRIARLLDCMAMKVESRLYLVLAHAQVFVYTVLMDKMSASNLYDTSSVRSALLFLIGAVQPGLSTRLPNASRRSFDNSVKPLHRPSMRRPCLSRCSPGGLMGY